MKLVITRFKRGFFVFLIRCSTSPVSFFSLNLRTAMDASSCRNATIGETRGRHFMSRISAFILAIALALPAAAQDRTVKFLVGFPAGADGRIHKGDYDKWGPVIRASGFKPGS
jgi:hypothetical protein